MYINHPNMQILPLRNLNVILKDDYLVSVILDNICV